MEDSWLYVEDNASSDYSLADSDKIDSETEADLYSQIHYEAILPKMCPDSENLNEKSSKLLVWSPLQDNVFCQDKTKNVLSPMEASAENLTPNNISQSNHCSDRKRKSSEMSVDYKKLEKSQFPAKKHKSDFDKSDSSSVIVYSSDSEDPSSKRNSKKKHDIIEIDSSDCDNNFLIIDSSDSDSNFFWTEQDSSGKMDLKTNLLDGKSFLNSSDSENKSNVSRLQSSKKRNLKNVSMPNIKIGENSKDLWQVNTEDLYRRKRFTRYHETSNVTCSNCNKKGHAFKLCPEPRDIKCFICGGPHVGARCRNRVCSNCYTPGHARMKCWKKKNLSPCHLCNMEGHVRKNCPDLWRRYHLTTKPGKIKKGNLYHQSVLYCWNCGGKGHFGGVCPYIARNSFSTWPCVISYDNPGAILKERLNGHRNSVNSNKAKQHKDSNYILSATERKKDMYFTPAKNTPVPELNNSETKGKRKKKNKTHMRFNKVQETARQSGFPRTPKKQSPKQIVDDLPESVEIILKRQLKKRRKNMMRRFKRANKLRQERNESLQNKELNFCHG